MPVFLVGKIRLRLDPAFLRQLRFHQVVLDDEISHGFEGCLLVKLAEFVEPHQVKGVEQLAADGIGGVVTVGELVIVYDYTGA